ncbi:hypothetical protein TRAPUB_10703 [Trametes pubescens]|uniref:Uncharacterized protein n=1 Tax=Trametes pubescens TaxID=154538 RepID=A0A1M2VYS8_TRAPU|nr:hypothetical protein TRAPUB_10703 [Trametes pubescens]
MEASGCKPTRANCSHIAGRAVGGGGPESFVAKLARDSRSLAFAVLEVRQNALSELLQYGCVARGSL